MFGHPGGTTGTLYSDTPMPAKAAPARNPVVSDDFAAAFAALKKLIEPYESQLRVTADTPTEYNTVSPTATYNQKPIYFAGVMCKSYVAFHFFPVYACPELLKGISPELKKRMQGKTCWNFKKVDEKLFAELAQLVEAGFQRFRSIGWL